MPLTSEAVRRMISASQEKARELGVAVSTAIVDAEGRLFAFERMEGSRWNRKRTESPSGWWEHYVGSASTTSSS